LGSPLNFVLEAWFTNVKLFEIVRSPDVAVSCAMRLNDTTHVGGTHKTVLARNRDSSSKSDNNSKKSCVKHREPSIELSYETTTAAPVS